LDAFLKNEGQKGATNVSTLIGLYGQNGFAVGDSLTWADLAIYDSCGTLFEKFPEFKDNYPALSASFANAAANEKLAAYVASRPATEF
jgi:hypothetical protein